MGPLVAFSVVFSSLFNLNSSDSIFKQIFSAPSSTRFPVQTRNTKSYTIALVGDSISKQKYGQGVVELSSKQRKKWAEERIAYIKNHIEYAKSHKIPLVNIYESSLTDKGDGREEYLNSSDYIHPSVQGIEFISQQIADYIFREEIIPN